MLFLSSPSASANPLKHLQANAIRTEKVCTFTPCHSLPLTHGHYLPGGPRTAFSKLFLNQSTPRKRAGKLRRSRSKPSPMKILRRNEGGGGTPWPKTLGTWHSPSGPDATLNRWLFFAAAQITQAPTSQYLLRHCSHSRLPAVPIPVRRERLRSSFPRRSPLPKSPPAASVTL